MHLLLQSWHESRAAGDNHMQLYRQRQPSLVWNPEDILSDVVADMSYPKLYEGDLVPTRVRDFFCLCFRPGDWLVLRPVILDEFLCQRVSGLSKGRRGMEIVQGRSPGRHIARLQHVAHVSRASPDIYYKELR